MAAGSPVSRSNGRATSSTPGSVLKAGAVAAVTAAATTGTLPTANGSITVANASSPTVAELLEYCTELNTKLAALVTALRNAGIMA